MALGVIFIHQVFFHQPHPHTRKRRAFIGDNARALFKLDGR